MNTTNNNNTNLTNNVSIKNLIHFENEKKRLKVHVLKTDKTQHAMAHIDYILNESMESKKQRLYLSSKHKTNLNIYSKVSQSAVFEAQLQSTQQTNTNELLTSESENNIYIKENIKNSTKKIVFDPMNIVGHSVDVCSTENSVVINKNIGLNDDAHNDIFLNMSIISVNNKNNKDYHVKNSSSDVNLNLNRQFNSSLNSNLNITSSLLIHKNENFCNKHDNNNEKTEDIINKTPNKLEKTIDLNATFDSNNNFFNNSFNNNSPSSSIFNSAIIHTTTTANTSKQLKKIRPQSSSALISTRKKIKKNEIYNSSSNLTKNNNNSNLNKLHNKNSSLNNLQQYNNNNNNQNTEKQSSIKNMQSSEVITKIDTIIQSLNNIHFNNNNNIHQFRHRKSATMNIHNNNNNINNSNSNNNSNNNTSNEGTKSCFKRPHSAPSQQSIMKYNNNNIQLQLHNNKNSIYNNTNDIITEVIVENNTQDNVNNNQNNNNNNNVNEQIHKSVSINRDSSNIEDSNVDDEDDNDNDINVFKTLQKNDSFLTNTKLLFLTNKINDIIQSEDTKKLYFYAKYKNNTINNNKHKKFLKNKKHKEDKTYKKQYFDKYTETSDFDGFVDVELEKQLNEKIKQKEEEDRDRTIYGPYSLNEIIAYVNVINKLKPVERYKGDEAHNNTSNHNHHHHHHHYHINNNHNNANNSNTSNNNTNNNNTNKLLTLDAIEYFDNLNSDCSIYEEKLLFSIDEILSIIEIVENDELYTSIDYFAYKRKHRTILESDLIELIFNCAHDVERERIFLFSKTLRILHFLFRTAIPAGVNGAPKLVSTLTEIVAITTNSENINNNSNNNDNNASSNNILNKKEKENTTMVNEAEIYLQNLSQCFDSAYSFADGLRFHNENFDQKSIGSEYVVMPHPKRFFRNWCILRRELTKIKKFFNFWVSTEFGSVQMNEIIAIIHVLIPKKDHEKFRFLKSLHKIILKYELKMETEGTGDIIGIVVEDILEMRCV